MCSFHLGHTGFFYAEEDASFAHVIDFLTAGEGERVLVMTTSRRWEAIAARLHRAATRGSVVVGDAAVIIDRTTRDGLFDPTRFDAELRGLMGDDFPPQRVYSEVASALVRRRDLPAALAL
jgi:hypothetical protein